MDLTSLLQGPMGNQLLQTVTNQLGINENQAQSAISSALPILLTALNQNAVKGDAQNINQALEKHNGSIFDNFASFLSSGVNQQDSLGILGHILGSNQTKVEKSISDSSGLSSAQVLSVLTILAPIVMNFLGKQKQQNGLDAQGITGLLGSLIGGKNSPGGANLSGFEKLLDQNGDGKITDDLMDLGSKFLGNFFKK
ncbi:Bacterial protein of uncharacterised function (DUF937) [Weeksella virosa]|uniref:DUF937 domain-containing protein n=1 Tax=Weeksella virosa TaxID=1014 RepID=UPI000DFC56FE|nr:DUF937 domain-containing protein [Weeksella virosa]SUP53396.1 Bacterial protein of uncharacterised function (DUF937) [Weeksella virosa]